MSPRSRQTGPTRVCWTNSQFHESSLGLNQHSLRSPSLPTRVHVHTTRLLGHMYFYKYHLKRKDNMCTHVPIQRGAGGRACMPLRREWVPCYGDRGFLTPTSIRPVHQWAHRIHQCDNHNDIHIIIFFIRNYGQFWLPPRNVTPAS